MTVKIAYVSNVLAFKHNKTIFLNKHLLKEPRLHEMVLGHELKHSNENDSKEDWVLDLKTGLNLRTQIELFWFALRHPSVFLGTFPLVIFKYQDLYYTAFMRNNLIIWALVLVLLWVII